MLYEVITMGGIDDFRRTHHNVMRFADKAGLGLPRRFVDVLFAQKET